MNKPWVAALGAFAGSSVAVLAISYLRDAEFNYRHAFSLGAGMAVGMYIVAQWKQQKEEQSSEPEDESSHTEQS